MKPKETAAAIANKTGLETATVQRVLRALAVQIAATLDADEPFILPGLGRIVGRDKPDGTKRYILRRAAPPEPGPQAEE